MGRKNKHKHGEAATRSSTNSIDLRTLELPSRPKPLKPADIRVLRVRLNASQALLARLLNVSSNTVESWEQGIRKPRQATTLKLLHIARKNPSVLLFPSPIKKDTRRMNKPKLRVIAGSKPRYREGAVMEMLRRRGVTKLTPEDREGYLHAAYGDPNIELDAEPESMLPEAIQKLPRSIPKIK